MKPFFSVLITLLIFSFISCQKEEGAGGTSTIAGKVWVQNYTTDFKLLISEYWAEEEDVYLIYGNDSIYSDKTSTDYEGNYWFQYLQEGNYTVFVYSKDRSSSSPSGRIPVKMEVNINKSKSDILVPQITILKTSKL